MDFVAKTGHVLLSALVWTFAGTVFGGLFAGAFSALDLYAGGDWLPPVLAVALAGTITASFFGSMQVSMMGGMAGVLSGIGFIMFATDTANPLPAVLIALAAAVLVSLVMPIGAIARSRPLGQAASGLAAGLAAGAGLALLSGTYPLPISSWLTSAVAVALMGVLYVVFSHLILGRCSARMSSRIGAPLVAAIIATTVALTIWLMLNTTPGLHPDRLSEDFSVVVAWVPQGALGGALGGAMGGAFMELLGIKLGEYQV